MGNYYYIGSLVISLLIVNIYGIVKMRKVKEYDHTHINVLWLCAALFAFELFLWIFMAEDSFQLVFGFAGYFIALLVNMLSVTLVLLVVKKKI